jgi:sulfur-oxidizing protein SoxZ
MAIFPVRIVMPATAKVGSTVDIKTLVQHVMETGYRRDDVGKAIPRDIISVFSVTYDGVEVFRTELNQGMAANPYIAFSTLAVASGTLVFRWSDDKGNVTTEVRQLTVT